MALFTSSEANACKIVRIDKSVLSGNTTWIICVEDADGNDYKLFLDSLGGDPNKASIKSAVSSALLSMEKEGSKEVPVITAFDNFTSDKGLGETIG